MPHFVPISPVSPLFLSSAAPCRAEGMGADDSTSIVVTALRTSVAQDKVTSSVTVLDQAAIEREQPIAVSDVLLRTPGTSTVRFGYYANVKQAHARRLELGGTVRAGGAYVQGNYSVVVAEDRTPPGGFVVS